MSVLTSINKRTNNRYGNSNTEREPSEFDGCWINVGCKLGESTDEAEASFVRLPRGIAVSDLKRRKIYDTMDPVFAAEANLMNQMIDLIEAQFANIKEGESKPVNLECVMYRRQEETDAVATTEANTDLATALFG